MYRTVARALWKPLSLLLVGIGLFLAYLLLKPVPPAHLISSVSSLDSSGEKSRRVQIDPTSPLFFEPDEQDGEHVLLSSQAHSS